jgi:4-amino-4-deoxy-L-arabinose transferase-like glycosyltransferase
VPASRIHGCLVALVAAVVLLTRLGGPALWDDDEPKNAACSLAMLDAGEWVVPTFNGRLRVEKPVLVNWLQMAGFAAWGRDECGARLPSALATIGTCLLSWRIGCLLFGPTAGLVGGLVMATSVWTAVGGRAATPDAALEFLVTLSVWLFVRGVGPERLRRGEMAVSRRGAAAVGAALGAAMLAKGPVGVVLPLVAFSLCAAATAAARSQGRPGRVAAGLRAVAALRPGWILAAVVAVAAPWYVLVTVRTAGAWPRGFFLVHNVERFVRPLEGHSGSLLYYPGVLCVGLFPWSIVLAAMLVHAVGIMGSRNDDRRNAMLLLGCWAGTWLGAFSCAGTKLPGYVWPAYPALAIATAVYLVDWARGRVPTLPRGWTADAVMRLAWCILAVAGGGVAIALPWAASRAAPGGDWLWLPGCIPLAAAALAWLAHAAGRPRHALAAVACGGCLFTTTLAGPVAEWFSRTQGPREIVAGLPAAPATFTWACLWNVPPSLVFYTNSRIVKLETPADVAARLAADPRSRVVIDSRQEDIVAAVLPPGVIVLARVPAITDHDWLLLGRAPAEPAGSPLAAQLSRDH